MKRLYFFFGILLCLPTLWSQDPHGGPVNFDAYLSTNGSFAVSLSTNPTIMAVWNVKEKRLITTVSDKTIVGVAFVSDTQFYVAEDTPTGVAVSEWNAADGKSQKELAVCENVKFIGFSPKGTYLVAQSDENIEVYTAQNGRGVEAFNKIKFKNDPKRWKFSSRDAYFSWDEKLLFLRRHSGMSVYEVETGTLFWNIESFGKVQNVTMHKLNEGFFLALGFITEESPNFYLYDGAKNLVKNWVYRKSDPRISVYNPVTGQIVYADHYSVHYVERQKDLNYVVKDFPVKTQPFYFKGVNFSQDGEYLIIAVSEPLKKRSAIAVYNWKTKKPVVRF